jgi:hypothetical protein
MGSNPTLPATHKHFSFLLLSVFFGRTHVAFDSNLT